MIEFISYSGEYPNLCNGILTLIINDKQVSFKDVLRSGGCIMPDGDYGRRAEEGSWGLKPLSKKYKKHEKEILNLVNENIKYGCCGGCI